jgi:hypothetical protein
MAVLVPRPRHPAGLIPIPFGQNTPLLIAFFLPVFLLKMIRQAGGAKRNS